MEMSVNGKILIPLTETKTEMKKLQKTETEKFETETDKFGYVHFHLLYLHFTPSRRFYVT